MNEADVRVDVSSIEHQLAELWRAEKHGDKDAVTRAALWNVVAHTWTSEQHAFAADVLAKASASVPQRTIVIQADPRGTPDIASWISANCHLIGAGKQVCSEEVAIVAAGERVKHIPPLVSALLLPDMPVAVWWLGDLPDEHLGYVDSLLDPADRLIVDSAQFNSAADLELVSNIAAQTTTAPADLNWARLEEWRAATAALFDPPAMRERLQAIRTVRVISGGDRSFGAISLALLYLGWMCAQTGQDLDFDFASQGSEQGLVAVEIHFADSSIALVRREPAHGVVVASSDGLDAELDCVTRSLPPDTEDLIVRLLKRPEADRVYLKALKEARRLAP